MVSSSFPTVPDICHTSTSRYETKTPTAPNHHHSTSLPQAPFIPYPHTPKKPDEHRPFPCSAAGFLPSTGFNISPTVSTLFFFFFPTPAPTAAAAVAACLILSLERYPIRASTSPSLPLAPQFGDAATCRIGCVSIPIPPCCSQALVLSRWCWRGFGGTGRVAYGSLGGGRRLHAGQTSPTRFWSLLMSGQVGAWGHCFLSGGVGGQGHW